MKEQAQATKGVISSLPGMAPTTLELPPHRKGSSAPWLSR
jgi:hypothetical protein